MPYGLFFFDVTADGSTAPDDDGADCFDASAARAEAAQTAAAQTAAEMLKDKPLREGPVTIVVRDQTGRPLFQVVASIQFRRWANRAETLPRFVILFPRRKTSRVEISKDPHYSQAANLAAFHKPRGELRDLTRSQPARRS